jgi:hypothetical protein
VFFARAIEINEGNYAKAKGITQRELRAESERE